MRWLCDNRETQVNEFEREITGVSVQHPATQTVRDSQDDAQLSLLGDAQQVSLGAYADLVASVSDLDPYSTLLRTQAEQGARGGMWATPFLCLMHPSDKHEEITARLTPEVAQRVLRLISELRTAVARGATLPSSRQEEKSKNRGTNEKTARARRHRRRDPTG